MTNSKENPTTPKLMDKLKEQMNPSFDVMLIPLHLEEEVAFLLYLKTAVDGDKLQNVIIKPFFEMQSALHYGAYIQTSPDILDIKSEEKIPLELTKGSVLIAVQQHFFLIDVKKVNTSAVQQTLMEPTVYGPQQALSEDILTNFDTGTRSLL